MYSPEELERDRQEAREKWVRDVEAARRDAWMEGLQQGRDEARKQGFEGGVLIGKIQAAQSVLNEPAGPTEELFQIEFPHCGRGRQTGRALPRTSNPRQSRA